MKVNICGHNYRHDDDFYTERPMGARDYMLLIIRSPARIILNGQTHYIKSNMGTTRRWLPVICEDPLRHKSHRNPAQFPCRKPPFNSRRILFSVSTICFYSIGKTMEGAYIRPTETQ